MSRYNRNRFRPEDHPLDGSTPILAALRDAGKKPASWTGTVHLHLAGKTGEVMYATGVLPGLRRAVPHARIVMHVAKHYHPSVLAMQPAFQPDELCERPIDLDVPLAEGVWRATSADDRHDRLVYEPLGNEIRVSLYRTHHPPAPRESFYRLFATAAGLLPGDWTRPLPVRPRAERGDVALVLGTANVHSPVRRVPRGVEWGRIAELALAAGLQPWAIGHAHDGELELPGWRPYTDTGLEPVLDLVANAQWLCGLNTGLLFTHLLIGPTSGRTLMLDPHRHDRYAFAYMPEVVDARHLRVGADVEATVVEAHARDAMEGA